MPIDRQDTFITEARDKADQLLRLAHEALQEILEEGEDRDRNIAARIAIGFWNDLNNIVRPNGPAIHQTINISTNDLRATLGRAAEALRPVNAAASEAILHNMDTALPLEEPQPAIVPMLAVIAPAAAKDPVVVRKPRKSASDADTLGTIRLPAEAFK